MPFVREGRMIGHSRLEIELAEPAVSETLSKQWDTIFPIWFDQTVRSLNCPLGALASFVWDGEETCASYCLSCPLASSLHFASPPVPACDQNTGAIMVSTLSPNRRESDRAARVP